MKPHMVLAAILLLAGCASTTVMPHRMQMLDAQAEGLSMVLVRDRLREGWRRVARLNEPWFYCAPDAGTQVGKLYAVPPGYLTDFGSVPEVVQSIVSPFGKHAEAAVIHDWMYDVAEVGQRREADRVMDVAMQERGVSWWDRFLINTAVGLFSGGPYARAEARKPEYWAEHFGNRRGEPETPPFAQPEYAWWKESYPCDQIDSAEDIDALKAEYRKAFPHIEW